MPFEEMPFEGVLFDLDGVLAGWEHGPDSDT